MRLIDADALREKLIALNYHTGAENMNEACVRAVDYAPTIGGWISVKERMPEDYVNVLIAMTDVAGTFVAVAWRENNGWNDGEGGWPDENVTHWMPLPEPPEEVGGDG